METVTFTLIVAGLDHETAGFEDRLLEARCDDATMSAQKGLVILEFSRESVGVAHAIQSATTAVERAGGHVLWVERTTS